MPRAATVPPAARLAVLLLALFICTAPAQADPIPFQAVMDLQTGNAPWPLVVADLDGDGINDMVVGNESGNSVSVFRGSSTPGTFFPRVDYAMGTAPRGVAVRDLNGDGQLDVVTANYLSGSVTVRLGTGLATLGTPISYGTGTGTYAVAIGDIDGLGGLDLVAVNAADNNATLLLGDGIGNFAVQASYATGSWPVDVAISDINDDGRMDVVVANYVSNSVSVLVGTAAPSYFSAHQTYAVGTAPWGLDVRDLNTDNRPDVVTANATGATVSVLLNNGSGGFAGAAGYPTGGSNSTAVYAGDLDLDGHVDLVVSDLAPTSIGILPGLGGGTYGPPQRLTIGAGQHDVVIADINHDGRPDIVCTRPSGSRVAWLLNMLDFGVALFTLPNPSMPGEPVTINAVVAPPTASGSVFFYHDDVFIEEKLVLSGGASIVYDQFNIGANAVKAVYSGDVTHLKDSIEVTHFVKVPSSVELASTPNPSDYRSPLTVTATVTPLTATGSVSFLRGTTALGVAGIVDGVATLPLDSLSLGVHLLKAVYGGDASLTGSEDTLTHVVAVAPPRILAVRDVPSDQGGKVFVAWRFSLDRPGVREITGYRVWRRLPAFAAQARALEAPERVQRFPVRNAAGATEDWFWEALADLPAAQLQNYGYTAATTQDSMADNNPYTAFFVQALTANAFTYYSTAPDSGYSVDNLAPAQPGPFVGVYAGAWVDLHWAANSEADLLGYRLHRGNVPGFVPSDDNLVTAQPDTGYRDIEGTSFSYYKLAAVDIHGNRSPFALVSPDAPTSVLASVQSVRVLPGRVELVWLLGRLAPHSTRWYASCHAPARHRSRSTEDHIDASRQEAAYGDGASGWAAGVLHAGCNRVG